LKLVALCDLAPDESLQQALDASLGGADPEADSAILKDEDRCIRCALCALRCPVDAIAMERVSFATTWRNEA
jgi:Fe-S-cluster-containing hydrogenase component 2